MATTRDVIANHNRRFREGNVDGILEDFADSAIVFTPSGPLKGRSEIRKFFEDVVAEFGKPGASIERHTESFDGDYYYVTWSAETPDNSYELATDTFVVRDGRIVMQSFAAKTSPKRADARRGPAH
jgi:hypothetical protein